MGSLYVEVKRCIYLQKVRASLLQKILEEKPEIFFVNPKFKNVGFMVDYSEEKYNLFSTILNTEIIIDNCPAYSLNMIVSYHTFYDFLNILNQKLNSSYGYFQ